MSLDNKLILAREHKIFVVAEAARGELAYPASTNLIVPAGYGQIGQVPTYSDSEEIVDSRSLIEQFRDALTSGDWSLPMYLRPSGSPGVAPQGGSLFKALFGSETVVGSTSVTYSLAKQLPSFSLWTKYGDTVFFATGATADQAKMGISKKGALKLDLSGKFMAMGWCGTDELSALIDYIATPITAIPVKDAKKYTVGGKIKVGTDDNAGAGYTITAVNVTTNTLTIAVGVQTDHAVDTVVAPFLPAGTIVGSPVESRTASVSFDGGSTAIKIKGMDLTIGNGIQYQEDEIQAPGIEYPTDYVEGQRSVVGTVTLLLRRDDLKYFYDGITAGVEKNIKISAGENTAGKRVSLTMGRSRIKAPTMNPSSPTVELRMDITALGTAGEDEISMLFN
ncbi:MAG: hypothetical protein KKH22_06560 [Proteobacteria bacterium]|nr:hypothetical protein [Pseudomonadota bacterium]